MTVYYLDGKYFGEALAEYRKKLDWNQEHVAHETGVTPGYVSAVENGKKPSLRFVNAWCLLIGCVEAEVALWHRYAARAHGWRV